TPIEVRDGQFEVSLRDLDAPYRLFFLDAANGLGAVADVTGKQTQDKPVTVRLAPCGSAKARFLDAQGNPLAGYPPMLWVGLSGLSPGKALHLDAPYQSAHALLMDHADSAHYHKDGPHTDAQGRVTLPGLIPGGTYWIWQEAVVKEFKVEAGQTV